MSDEIEESVQAEPPPEDEGAQARSVEVDNEAAAEAAPEPDAEAVAESAQEPAEGDDEQAEGPGLGKTLLVDPHDLPGAVEALILVSDKPIAAVRLARLTRSDLNEVKAAIETLTSQYQDRGIVLDEIAGGYQFRTHRRYAPVVRNLLQQKPTRLTRAQLEVLSIIAYRQPVTRPELEEVRGVDSGSAVRVLLERGLIRIIGKKDEAGRPMLYATTNEFLSLFGLKSLRDLPTLREFTELSDESRDMFERRIGERPPLEGFTADAQDAQAVAAREAELRQSSDDDADVGSDSDGAESSEALEPEAVEEQASGEAEPPDDLGDEASETEERDDA